ncbi:MFS transporter [Echinicola sp. 20G]|uniref:MFS transporter n=1 Tax=Echinicola sp. 20G TaxID=2781961 RepID=UPI0019106A14|nr:MFS transporter [Echinicola sp. 20G]
MRKALLALAIGGFGIGTTEFVIMGILPEIAEAFQISIPKAGHFIAAYALGVVVGAPILTTIGNRWPANKVLFALMIWFTIFNTLSAFSNNYTSFLIMRFLSGLPHGAFFGIGAVVAGKLSKEGKEAQAISIMFGGLTVANVVGVPLATFLGKHFQWNITFLIVGIIGLLTLASVKLWMPTMEKSSSSSISQEFSIFKRSELWLSILLTAIGTGGFFAWYSYIAPLITNVAGHPETVVPYAMILAGLGMVFGNFIGAKLAEKMLPIYAVMITLVMMALMLVANTYLATDKTAVLIMTFIIGTVSFCLVTPIQIVIIKASKGAETLGSSLNQSSFNIGNALGAYLAGLPIAMGYGFTSADLVGAGIACSGLFIAIAILMVRKKKEKKRALMKASYS